MKVIHIIDYGTGNIGSLISLVESLGFFALVTESPSELIDADIVILPGVGSAGVALSNLRLRGAYDALCLRYEKMRPIVGICLGAQLFGGFLHESGDHGFGWLKGDVMPLSHYPFYNNGWCRLDYDALQYVGLARALKPSSTFFFNHKYVMGLDIRQKVSVAQRPDIPAIYLDKALCAIQFHPEKSQQNGRLLLRNVLEDHYGL